MSTFEESVETTFDTARILSGQGAKRDDVAKWIANVLEQSFLIIDRDELPVATIIQRDGKDHVEVDSSEAGTWPISINPEHVRRWGLEYLAAAELIVEYRSKRGTLQRQLDGRRDDIVHEFVGPLWGYSDTTDLVRRMTDRIIEIQDKK